MRLSFAEKSLAEAGLHYVLRGPAAYECMFCGEARSEGDGFVGTACPRAKAWAESPAKKHYASFKVPQGVKDWCEKVAKSAQPNDGSRTK